MGRPELLVSSISSSLVLSGSGKASPGFSSHIKKFQKKAPRVRGSKGGLANYIVVNPFDSTGKN